MVLILSLVLIVVVLVPVVVTADCSENEFQCNDGNCIMHGWECDGDTDCPDKSDERLQLCGPLNCSLGYFSCGDGLPCIPESWKCDSHDDCQNGIDEKSCDHTKCKDAEFQCKQPQRCITSRWRCDHDWDCTDGSDEEDCKPKLCTNEEFNCSNGRCIPPLWRCDGDNDCADNTDEVGCNVTTVVKSCGPEDFLCVTSLECIHKAWQCDGDNDCQDDSDEKNCGRITCASDHFSCLNGTCIPSTLRCDGDEHCPDGSDEKNCNNNAEGRTCNNETQFDCTGAGSRCVGRNKLCDGTPNCPGGEDEDTLLCSTSNLTNPCVQSDNGGCSHKCINTRTSHYCVCNSTGYQLAADNQTCDDIDECAIPGTCSQACENRPGSYKCSCKQGYEMDHKDQRCKAAGEEPRLLFANRHDLREIRLHTGLYQPLVDKLHSAIALDYDYKEQLIYWSDVARESITRGLIRGGNDTANLVLVTQDISTPDGLALDWIHKNLYWTDTGNNRIEVMSVSDPSKPWRKILFQTQLDEPRAIVVDPRTEQRYMYWTDWGDVPKIERANLDGSDRYTLLHSRHGLVWPNGLAIDYETNSLFWVDAKLHHIASSDLNGNRSKIVFTSFSYLKHPFAITVFEDDIYWSDWEAESILKVSKYHTDKRSNAVKHIALHLYAPMDVHIYHALKQPTADNACSASPCQQLCFPLRDSSSSFVCACSEYGDTYRLNPDGRTCTSRSTPTTPAVPGASVRRTTTNTRSQGGGGGEMSKDFSGDETEYGKHESDTSSDKSDRVAEEHQRDSYMRHIIMLILGLITLMIAIMVAGLVHRCYVMRKPKVGLNFDNPVYRRTTEDDDQFCLQRSATLQPWALSSLLQPLTSTAPNNNVLI